MLSLAAYESSSDEESELQPVATAPPAAITKPNSQKSVKRKVPPSSSSSCGGKAKKILPASLLPPEIQAALARGADMDSDSDSDEPVVTRATNGSTLISRLPAPANDAAAAVQQQAQRIGVVTAAWPNNATYGHENDSDSDSSEVNKKSQQVPTIEQGGDRDGHENEGQDDSMKQSADVASEAFPKDTSKPSNVLFSLHTDDIEKRSHQPQRAPEVSIPSIRTQRAAAAPVTATTPSQPAQQRPQYQPYVSAPNTAYATNTQYLAATGAYNPTSHAHAQPQQYATPDAAYHAYAQLHAQAPGPAGPTGHVKSARKRDREIQQQLLAGNTAVLEEANIRTVQPTASGWDPVKYTERAKQEAQVMAAYNIGQPGQDQGGVIMQPTRTMNRRHHINSLAMAAAEMEISLLDHRGQQNKTKSQTQAKYGW